MKKRPLNRALAAVLCLAIVFSMLMLSACASKKDSETIKIGAIDPLTGNNAALGRESLNGKKMAIDDINAAGGVLGKQLELVSEDDEGKAASSTTAATKLITKDDVVAIAGPHNSSCTLAAMEAYEEYKVPGMTPGASSVYVTTSGNDWISRCIPDDDAQPQILVKYAKDEYGVKKLGLLYSNEDYGIGGFEYVQIACEKFGVELKAEAFNLDDTDMSTQISNLKNADCDAVLIWTTYSAGALLCKQIRELGWDCQLFASPGLNNPPVFDISNNAVDGMILTSGFYAQDPDSYVSEWVARYRELYGEDPSQTSANAYDTIRIIAAAIERAGSTDHEAVAKEIRKTADFQSLKGIMSINAETGNYIGKIRLVQCNAQNQSFDYIAEYYSSELE